MRPWDSKQDWSAPSYHVDSDRASGPCPQRQCCGGNHSKSVRAQISDAEGQPGPNATCHHSNLSLYTNGPRRCEVLLGAAKAWLAGQASHQATRPQSPTPPQPHPIPNHISRDEISGPGLFAISEFVLFPFVSFLPSQPDLSNCFHMHINCFTLVCFQPIWMRVSVCKNNMSCLYPLIVDCKQ